MANENPVQGFLDQLEAYANGEAGDDDSIATLGRVLDENFAELPPGPLAGWRDALTASARFRDYKLAANALLVAARIASRGLASA